MGVQNFFLVTAVLDVRHSGRHHKTLPADFLAKAHGLFTKRLLVPERGLANPRQLAEMPRILEVAHIARGRSYQSRGC